MRRIIPAMLGALLMTGTALADDYDAVRSALDAGDYDTAFATLAEMGDGGDTLAMVLLANLQLGYTTAGPNYGLGLAWLEQAAEAGNIHAMIQLGSLYQYDAPAIDRAATQMGALYPVAVRWFQRAIDAGSIIGVSRLGMLHRLGVLPIVDESVSREDEAAWAHDLLTQAAEAGRPEAMSVLATMLRRDDPARAGELMLQAALLGDPFAIAHLSWVPDAFGITDPVEATAWAMAAREAWALSEDPRSLLFMLSGTETGAEFLAAMDARIAEATPEQRAAAEPRAAEIAANWTSLLPGQSAPQGGGLFGRN